jgi:hypothetical protein
MDAVPLNELVLGAASVADDLGMHRLAAKDPGVTDLLRDLGYTRTAGNILEREIDDIPIAAPEHIPHRLWSRCWCLRTQADRHSDEHGTLARRRARPNPLATSVPCGLAAVDVQSLAGDEGGAFEVQDPGDDVVNFADTAEGVKGCHGLVN